MYCFCFGMFHLFFVVACFQCNMATCYPLERVIAILEALGLSQGCQIRPHPRDSRVITPPYFGFEHISSRSCLSLACSGLEGPCACADSRACAYFRQLLAPAQWFPSDNFMLPGV